MLVVMASMARYLVLSPTDSRPCGWLCCRLCRRCFGTAGGAASIHFLVMLSCASHWLPGFSLVGRCAYLRSLRLAVRSVPPAGVGCWSFAFPACALLAETRQTRGRSRAGGRPVTRPEENPAWRPACALLAETCGRSRAGGLPATRPEENPAWRRRSTPPGSRWVPAI